MSGEQPADVRHQVVRRPVSSPGFLLSNARAGEFEHGGVVHEPIDGAGRRRVGLTGTTTSEAIDALYIYRHGQCLPGSARPGYPERLRQTGLRAACALS